MINTTIRKIKAALAKAAAKALVAAAPAVVSCLPAGAQMNIDFSYDSPLRKLQIAEMAINNLYVDSVDEKKLVEDAIRGMLEKLDPHSSYSDPEAVKAMNEPLQGNFDGIGVQFNMVDDTLLVIQPVSKGPSEKVGIMAGDRIVNVNDTAIAGVKMKKEEIMKRLRGPRGTTVKLGIVRRGVPDVMYFTVKRDKIPVKSVDAVYMIRPQIGYIRIGNFGATTYKEFMEGMEKLKAEGMKDLILDLQDNGGGYLQAAVEIANEFLPKDDLIVYIFYIYHPLYFSFSIDNPLLIFYLFCTKYDFFARSKTFYELRNNSAINLFPSLFNIKFPSYFFTLL